jgi:ATP-dependent DNA helicase RecG
VGPQRAKLLAKVGIEAVGDLIEYFPFRHEHQGRPQSIDSLTLDAHATVIGVVDSVRANPARRGAPNLNLRLSDGTGTVRVAWFNAPYLRDRFRRGQVLRVYGQVGEFEGLGQFVNPTVEVLDPQANPKTWDFERVVPIYRAVASLSTNHITRIVDNALQEAITSIVEPLPDVLRKRRGLLGRPEAVRLMHHPDNPRQAVEARRRLAYDELFTMQLAISLQRRWTATRAKAPKLPVTPEIDYRIRRRFPFALTAAQNKVIAEIAADLSHDKPMTRLLQGDVGSGKTVVALYAALTAIACKKQCAILAPTEVLAAQHFSGIERYLAGSRVERCLLTGKTPKSHRDNMLKAIATGDVNLVVGTQALLETAVKFADIGLVVVDEQHKFGVSQRATMRGKETVGRQARDALVPHYLVMTATPIPRTLSMTVFGDLDVSIIDALPPGRQPIFTRIIRPQEEAEAWRAVRGRIAQGDQAYIVYPLVEESDDLDLKAATVEVDRVARDLLPGVKVGLLHGRMKNAEKRAVMAEFAAGHLDALVSTTVIEVGVDVPNATVMVVQHAERYGLAALHQLRGRVGRGSKASICLLMTNSESDLANERLGILHETTDGFRIAEEDLRIRGPGELLGTHQHGWPEFRVANLVEDTEILMQARDDAAELTRRDPALKSPDHAALKAELRRRFHDKVAFIHAG